MFLLTPLVGAVGALLADHIGWPLPWMVGSMVAVIVARCSGWALVDVPHGRRIGQWLIASVIGLHFTVAVLGQVADHFLMMIFAALLTLATALVGIALINRSGVDLPTSYFSLMPANSAEMIILGERYQANAARVAAAHSLRLVVIVLLIPAAVTWSVGVSARHIPAPVDWFWLAILLPSGFLVAWLWTRLGAPNGWAFGPMLVCAIFTVAFSLHLGLPSWLSKFGQLLLGCSLGSYFDRAFFRSAPEFLGKVLLFTLAAIAVAFGAGWGMSFVVEIPAMSLALGLMPGSSTEMSLTAEALSLGVALVTAMQIIRMVVVMLIAEALFKRWSRHALGRKDP
ncbi:AbrB family transcriptional regulator [Pseudomonas sp. MOB-449]|nr:AbrB family transcriptional regulator [Pseudomonas sp. MOB-449]